MRRSDRDLHDQSDGSRVTTDALADAALAVSFARHPAAIERHTREPDRSDTLARAATTWFPYDNAALADPAGLAEWPDEPVAPPAADFPLPAPEPARARHDPHPPLPFRPAYPIHDDAPAPDYPDAPESLAAVPDLPPRALQDATAADDHWLLEPAPQPVRRLRVPVPAQLRRVRLGRRAALAGVAAILAVAGVALLAPLFGGGGISAVFNAPMLVVRAKVAGRVMTVPAMAGQIVAPDSPLLTLHVGDGDGPDRTIQAGVHGVIRSVETVPGADLAAGAALVRLQDCDRAFLTVGRATTLRPGETVRVMLPNLPPLAGTVRRSAGVMEPPDTLVVALPAGALATSCPVGSEGSVTTSAGPDR